MPCRCAPNPKPAPLYFAECRYGRLGNEFQALDRDKNSRAGVIREIRSGGIDPRVILEVIEPCDEYPNGRVADVTAELTAEAGEPRDPRTLDEIGADLRDMLRDHDRDLKKHGVHGW